MFCFQCQEATMGRACTVKGACGKTQAVANLQDLLVYLLRGLSFLNQELRKKGNETSGMDHFISESLYMTLTNANFDKRRFVNRIREALIHRESMKEQLGGWSQDIESYNLSCAGCLSWKAETVEEMDNKAKEIGVLTTSGEDIRSLREFLIYGLKGMAAYASHAAYLGFEDPTIYQYMQETLIDTRCSYQSVDDLMEQILECGRMGIRVMEVLDKAHTDSYGIPEITPIKISVRTQPGILVTGQDLRDLKDLLDQTKDTQVDVYTHGEMLSAHTYPYFKQYTNLAGNYGNAWWKQEKEFEMFHGPVLITSNCLAPPKQVISYSDRLYTTGAVGFPGFPHITDPGNGKPKDFSALIERALRCIPPQEIETGTIMGGFVHGRVVPMVTQIVKALKSGAIRRFFVMCGYDGRHPERDYYTEIAKRLPLDTVILTSGCAKYRYNKLPLGTIAGYPRVWDAGQCNDSYTWILVALKLQQELGVKDLNDVPVTFNIAWYEQKTILLLMALLSLGIRNIYLGPTLPAFFSPNVARNLFNRWGLSGIETPDDDLKLFLRK